MEHGPWVLPKRSDSSPFSRKASWKARVFLTETKTNTATDLGSSATLVDFLQRWRLDRRDRIGSTSNWGQPHPTEVEPSNTKRIGHFANPENLKTMGWKTGTLYRERENISQQTGKVRKIIIFKIDFSRGYVIVPRGGNILPQGFADLFVPYKSDIFRTLSATWWYQAAGSKLLVIHQGLRGLNLQPRTCMKWLIFYGINGCRYLEPQSQPFIKFINRWMEMVISNHFLYTDLESSNWNNIGNGCFTKHPFVTGWPWGSRCKNIPVFWILWERAGVATLGNRWYGGHRDGEKLLFLMSSDLDFKCKLDLYPLHPGWAELRYPLRYKIRYVSGINPLFRFI